MSQLGTLSDYPPEFLQGVCCRILTDVPQMSPAVEDRSVAEFTRRWTHTHTHAAAWTKLCGAVILAIYNAPSPLPQKPYEHALPLAKPGCGHSTTDSSVFDYMCRYLGVAPGWEGAPESVSEDAGCYVACTLTACVISLLRMWPMPFPYAGLGVSDAAAEKARISTSSMECVLRTFSEGTMRITDRNCMLPGLGSFSLMRLGHLGFEYAHELVGVYLMFLMHDETMLRFLGYSIRIASDSPGHAQPRNLRVTVLYLRNFITHHGVHMPWLPRLDESDTAA